MEYLGYLLAFLVGMCCGVYVMRGQVEDASKEIEEANNATLRAIQSTVNQSHVITKLTQQVNVLEGRYIELANRGRASVTD